MPGKAHPTQEVDPKDYRHPSLQCDIVMKGGITSGVVYPGAVLELARRYRFRSIGGASAGAIAAGVVAAAEHARERDGFVEVAKLPEAIASQVDGRPFILQLFAPDRSTRPLFEAGVGFMRWNPLRAGFNVLRWFWVFPVVAALVATTSILLSVLADADAAFAVAGFSAAVAILLVGLAADIVRTALRLDGNDFGVCHLGPQAGSPTAPALTGWLHERLQSISGKAGSGPLTFADLWGVPPLPESPSDADRREREKCLIEASRNPQNREIDLQMMTTNLSHGHPMRLPVPIQLHRKRLEEGGELLFDPAELHRFFPDDVMVHLEAHGPEPSPMAAAHLAREAPGTSFRHLPVGGDLPVIVATRMSLSFPVLIAAIPLWELDYQEEENRPRLRRVIFSDGGITSNFPVHFFDSPMPSRPTFGLQLTGFDAGDGPDPHDPGHSVDDPGPVTGTAKAPWIEIKDVVGFLTAIKDAMQNWRDNAQSELPGFRERIVHIKLDRGEGGLNLAMPADRIKDLTRRGGFAGRRLVELFSGDPDAEPIGTKRWNDHRFARYRGTMSLIERFLGAFHRGYKAPPDNVTTPYPERIAQGLTKPFPFKNETNLRYAQQTTDTYLELVEISQGTRKDLCEEVPTEGEPHSLDDRNVPRPRSVLRAVPPV